MKKIIIVAVIGFMLAFSSSYAHSGGTDANGCHTNHKTGEYHCHGRR